MRAVDNFWLLLVYYNARENWVGLVVVLCLMDYCVGLMGLLSLERDGGLPI